MHGTSVLTRLKLRVAEFRSLTVAALIGCASPQDRACRSTSNNHVPGHPHTRDDWSPRRGAIALVILLALSLAVRLWHPVGWLGSDDAAYHAAAEHVLLGEPIERVHHHYARSPVVIVTAAFMWLFGENVAAAIAPSLYASLVCIALVVAIGRTVWGWREGIIAGAVLSATPVFANSSTCLLPTPHTCLWAATAVLLALVGIRSRGFHVQLVLAMCSGFAAGIATSAKVFAGASVPVAMALFCLARQRESTKGGNAPKQHLLHKASLCASTFTGFALFFAAESVFYAAVAHDPLFKPNAIRQSNGNPDIASAHVVDSIATLRSIAWARLTMPFRTNDSTWGIVGMAFWPAVAGVLLFAQRGRLIAVWAIATYMLAAFAPLGVSNGWRVFPWFDGRNISVICVPMALCIGWMLCRIIRRTAAPRMTGGALCAAVIAVLGIGEYSRIQLGDGMSFEQRRVGLAISRLLAHDDWPTLSALSERYIYVAPSIYWRYRILFPPEVRPRLRVVADKDSPTWWQQASADVADRWHRGPLPAGALILATPKQLRGEAHVWEYGVRWPKEATFEWPCQDCVLAASAAAVGDAYSSDGDQVLLITCQPTAQAVVQEELRTHDEPG